ncbi:MAG: hypothetical protein M0Z50_13140 [Planctomycetia bacterium]|nr:hypothetical protein [Planctomycetia bacterium]
MTTIDTTEKGLETIIVGSLVYEATPASRNAVMIVTNTTFTPNAL